MPRPPNWFLIYLLLIFFFFLSFLFYSGEIAFMRWRKSPNSIPNLPAPHILPFLFFFFLFPGVPENLLLNCSYEMTWNQNSIRGISSPLFPSLVLQSCMYRHHCWGGGSLTKAAMNIIIIMLPKLSPSKRRIHRVIDNDRWRRGGPEGNRFPHRISISLLLFLVLGQNTRGCRCWERPPTSIQLLPITSKFEQAPVSQAKKVFL